MPQSALTVVERFLQDPRTLGRPRVTGVTAPLLLAAASGGADSMVLLDCLDQLRAAHNFRLAAVHVHHGLRGRDADQDAVFVRSECEARGIGCYVIKGDTQQLMATKDLSIEEAARQVRYTAFAEAVRQSGATAVVVAHHLDDDVETLLMRLITGGSLHALAGMEAVAQRFGVYVWRPFLRIPQAVLYAHLRERNLKYRTDLSNLETGMLRNRIRLELLPRIKSDFNPQVIKTLGKLMEELKALRTAELPDPGFTPPVGLASVHPAEVDSQIEADVLEEASHHHGSDAHDDQWQFPVIALQGLEPRERWGLWKGVLRGVGISPKYLTRELFEDLDTLISRTHGTLAIDLPGGRIARRTYGTLVIGPRLDPSPATGEVKFALKDWSWTNDYAGWVILAERIGAGDAPNPQMATPLSRWWEEALFQTTVGVDRAATGLVVRPRRGGDDLALPGGGHRSLKEWFIDAKLPQLFRDHWPVIALPTGQPIWAPGLPHGPLGTGETGVRLTAVKTAHWG